MQRTWKQAWFQISDPEHSDYNKDRAWEKLANYFKLGVAHLCNVLELFWVVFFFLFLVSVTFYESSACIT